MRVTGNLLQGLQSEDKWLMGLKMDALHKTDCFFVCLVFLFFFFFLAITKELLEVSGENGYRIK